MFEPPPRPARKRSWGWLAGLPLLLWPLYLLHLGRVDVPAFNELRRERGVVQQVHESSSRWGDSYVSMRVFTGERVLTVHAPSWLRAADVPRLGDTVEVWTAFKNNRARRAWQMDLEGRRVLSYARSVRAARNRRRTSRTLAYVALGTVLLLTLAAAFSPRKP